MAVDSTRVCAGCGGSGRPDEFERFVWEERVGLIHDLRGKAPGRGAHVHPTPDCLSKAAKFGFNRSFRAEVEAPEPDKLVEQVREAIRTRLEETARLAVRSQAAHVGQKALELAMKADSVSLVLVATDAGSATSSKFSTNADRKSVPVVEQFDGAAIGAWSGREFVAVMGMHGRLAERFRRDVSILGELGLFEG